MHFNNPWIWTRFVIVFQLTNINTVIRRYEADEVDEDMTDDDDIYFKTDAL